MNRELELTAEFCNSSVKYYLEQELTNLFVKTGVSFRNDNPFISFKYNNDEIDSCDFNMFKGLEELMIKIEKFQEEYHMNNILSLCDSVG